MLSQGGIHFCLTDCLFQSNNITPLQVLPLVSHACELHQGNIASFTKQQPTTHLALLSKPMSGGCAGDMWTSPSQMCFR